jgi:phosphatidylserine/phosphatidylglycerophosphate/cardiolipin synthase-like enzyme
MKIKIFIIIVVVALFYSNCIFASTQVYFSPTDGCQDVIISEISKASETIDIAMYYFTAREIAQELVEAKGRGVKVRVLLDPSQETQTYSKSRYLINKGFDIRYYVGSGLMHNKFAIIDSVVLITGSYNWTAAANQRNEENVLIITDTELIKKHQERFEYLWEKGRKVE